MSSRSRPAGSVPDETARSEGDFEPIRRSAERGHDNIVR
jgi:hypothetical protein